MKAVHAIAAVLSVAVFMGGCDHGVHASHDPHDHAHDQHAVPAGAAMTLVLNNGERWLMDDHTRTVMAEMETTFYTADHANHVSLNTVGVQLSQQVEKLIAGCVMDGKAHEQLHIFLTDFIPTVNAMASAGTLDSARQMAFSIKAQLDNYKKYFQ